VSRLDAAENLPKESQRQVSTNPGAALSSVGRQGDRVIFRIVRLENGKPTTLTVSPARARRIAARIFQAAAEIDPDGTDQLVED
jgi:hypothetical protein